jgi:molybdate transport system substrate-binding protein
MSPIPAIPRRPLLLILLLAFTGIASTPASAAGPVVFAAASLKNAFDEVNAAWAASPDTRALPSYGASSALAKQIDEGAPADLFFSADRDWMDFLADRRRIALDSRVDLLGNRLVLIAPQRSPLALAIAPGFGLRGALGEGRLALADVAAVPAGKYAKAALLRLGVWNDVADRTAPAENVRAALLLVARGEAPLGVVYATDARAEPSVRVVDIFPADSHPAIVYPVARVAASTHPGTTDLLRFLRSDSARAIFVRHGFAVLP